MSENPDPKTGTVNLVTPDFARHPQPVYRRMHSRCPVARATWANTPVVSRYSQRAFNNSSNSSILRRS